MSQFKDNDDFAYACPPRPVAPAPSTASAGTEQAQASANTGAASNSEGVASGQSRVEAGPPKDPVTPYYKARPFDPVYVMQQEKPSDRMLLMLAAQGYTTREIAEKTGFSTMKVAYTIKQPWAQTQIAEMQTSVGRKAAYDCLQGAALEAAQALIAVMRNEDGESRPGDRTKAANSILERVLPTTSLTMHTTVNPSELSDAELLKLVNENSLACSAS